MTQVTTVYDRFTTLAKLAIVAARDAAARLGHDTIGTEHILLGLAQTAGVASEILRAQGAELGSLRAEVAGRQSASAAPSSNPSSEDALSTLGIDIEEIRRRAEQTFGPGALKYPRPPFSLHAKQAIKEALQQARLLEKENVDTEHLLLALLATGGTAASVLTTVGVDPESLRQAVLERSAA